jgi:hypothetical protein
MNITIDGTEYDVPEAVAKYVTDKQAAEQRAVTLGKQIVDGQTYVKALRFMDLPEKQQFAVVMQALVHNQKGTLAIMELCTEFAAKYKAARDKGEAT